MEVNVSKPRDPNANNNMATARISDVTKAELKGLAVKSGLTLSEVTRKAITEGLPILKRKLAKK